VTQGLTADEHVQITRLASMAQGRMTKGGRLFVTNHRVLFRPHVIDRLFGARDVSMPRSEVAEVDVAPRTRGLFDGGLRRRLVIRLRDGNEHLFVVNRVEALASDLRRELM
jgi:hypothetical protein